MASPTQPQKRRIPNTISHESGTMKKNVANCLFLFLTKKTSVH